MKLSTIVRVRAYLVAASMSAVAIQLGALVSIFAFGVPEAYFQTLTFRLAAAGAICAVVFVVAVFAAISPMFVVTGCPALSRDDARKRHGIGKR
jgi:membrane protein implicated in regulation of membrane protease activity